MRISHVAPILASVLFASACGGENIDTNRSEDVGEAESPLVATWTAIGGTTNVAPAPVTFLGDLYLFAKGVGDSKVYVRSSSNGSTWGGWTQLSGITTDAGLAPVVFGGQLYVFAKGATDNEIYVNTTTNGSTWSGWSNPFTGTTNVAVAAVVYGTKLYIFSKGIGDNTIYMTSSTNGTSWTTWLAIPGTTDVAPAAVSFGGKLILFSKGISDDKIYFSTSTNGTLWSSWTEFDGSTGGNVEWPNQKKSTTATGVRAAVFSNDLYVMNVDPDDDRIYASMTRDFSIWSGWFEVPPMSRTTDAAVGVAPFGNGLYWFAKGTSDNAIYEESTPVYRLPFSAGSGWGGGNNWDDVNPSHNGPGQAYAYDMGHGGQEGDDVRAMRGGTVTGFFNNSNCNTNVTPMCDGSGNWVHIRHPDGTVAAYLHMQFHSVTVTLGQPVAQGDTIGKVGNTGSSSAAHIHVDVRQFEDSPGGNAGPTIPFYFEDNNHLTVPWRPRKGDTLSSNQP